MTNFPSPDYHTLFMFGPPTTDITIDARHFSPKINGLVKKTHYLLEHTTMCYTIWKGDDKVEALLDAYHKAFEQNNLAREYKYVTRQSADNLEYKERIELPDRDQNLYALQGNEIHQGVNHEGLINWSVVAWRTQTGFFFKKIKVQYGNCPCCYRPFHSISKCYTY